jgi:hypothetical protein
MSVSSHLKIREVLHQYPDGLTTVVIAGKTGIKRDTVQNALINMPDTYIDRWQLVYREPPHAVWIAIVPPENCPKP